MPHMPMPSIGSTTCRTVLSPVPSRMRKTPPYVGSRATLAAFGGAARDSAGSLRARRWLYVRGSIFPPCSYSPVAMSTSRVST